MKVADVLTGHEFVRPLKNLVSDVKAYFVVPILIDILLTLLCYFVFYRSLTRGC